MDEAVIASRMRAFAHDAGPRSPLSSRLAEAGAGDPLVVGILRSAPPGQQLPVMLLAAVHFLLLGRPDAALRAWYPNLAAGVGRAPAQGDPAPAFLAFCHEHAGELREIVTTRRVQTNEVGRCSLLLPALAMVGDERGPLALVDVGASAGLNLQLDEYHYRYEPDRRGDDRGAAGPPVEVGPPSPVTLTCGTRGDPPLPTSMPTIAARRGLDRSPIDVTDDEAARWLEAAVWPDQPERFARLRAAIGIARAAPPTVVAGDAVDDLGPLVAGAAAQGHPVVTTTWVLGYLSAERRARFVERLDELGAASDLSWVYAEPPELTGGLPTPAGPDDAARLTTLVLVRWRGGRRDVRRLATCHPHGFWMHWELGTRR